MCSRCRYLSLSVHSMLERRLLSLLFLSEPQLMMYLGMASRCSSWSLVAVAVLPSGLQKMM